MRQAASALAVVLLALGGIGGQAAAVQVCWIDPTDFKLVCEDDGTITDPGTPPRDPPVSTGGLRYLWVRNEPGIGDCHYWSNTPGGVDAWDPANDPTVIGIVLGTPECPPVAGVDPEVRAWEIFRSWDLDPPDPSFEPADHGITGLPTFVASAVPAPIIHTEVLPDGRVLTVRADVIRLTVDWGDGEAATYPPETATSYPDGGVTHVYALKTCTPEYRENHPSGGLCHPFLDHYDVAVTSVWGGSFDVGVGWVDLGTLDRTVVVAYDVDELRGVPIP